MPFKPNYNHQRAERARLKQAKQDAKRQERAEAATRRRAEGDVSPASESHPDGDGHASLPAADGGKSIGHHEAPHPEQCRAV